MNQEDRESPASRLETDHRGMDELFDLAEGILSRGSSEEAMWALDRIWMRLAVHIRAEHKILFPALAERRPELREAIQGLREDHDFFMASLAALVQSLRSAETDPSAHRASVSAIRQRLELHNAKEETGVYPFADQLPDEQRARMSEEIARELSFLPDRYGPRSGPGA